MFVETPAEVSECSGPAFTEALRRVKAEYLEMPGLQLTRAQAARLWAMDSRMCDAVLRTLVEARFLICTRGASFVRAQ